MTLPRSGRGRARNRRPETVAKNVLVGVGSRPRAGRAGAGSESHVGNWRLDLERLLFIGGTGVEDRRHLALSEPLAGGMPSPGSHPGRSPPKIDGRDLRLTATASSRTANALVLPATWRRGIRTSPPRPRRGSARPTSARDCSRASGRLPSRCRAIVRSPCRRLPWR